MQRLRFRSNIDATCGLALALLAACGDDPAPPPDAAVCGPGPTAVATLETDGDAQLVFGELTAGINNDCPSANTPSGVISMTIIGRQIGGQGLITLCVSRPDLLTTDPQDLVNDVPGSAEVLLVDLAASADGCTFELDQSQDVFGTVTAVGLCGNGSDKAGFSLSISGGAALQRKCGDVVDNVDIAVLGHVAIAAP